MEALARALGKSPITVKNNPGFVVNRILCPMINEAIFVLAEGLASPEEIDAGMKLGCNHPIGPLALVLIDHALRHRAQCGDVVCQTPRIPAKIA